MRRTNPTARKSLLVILSLCTLAVATSGCAFGPGTNEAFFDRVAGRDAVERQLAGEALVQRKYSMRRVRRDLARFRTTLEQLQRHGKTTGIARFERFTRPYLEQRVAPLIESTDGASHPELRPFRAELLLSQAILQFQMGDQREVRRTIAHITDEFSGVGSMLVLYPTGQAVTLDQGVALLRAQTGEI